MRLYNSQNSMLSSGAGVQERSLSGVTEQAGDVFSALSRGLMR